MSSSSEYVVHVFTLDTTHRIKLNWRQQLGSCQHKLSKFSNGWHAWHAPTLLSPTPDVYLLNSRLFYVTEKSKRIHMSFNNTTPAPVSLSNPNKWTTSVNNYMSALYKLGFTVRWSLTDNIWLKCQCRCRRPAINTKPTPVILNRRMCKRNISIIFLTFFITDAIKILIILY